VTQCAAPQAPKGTRLPVTPEFKGNVTARYEFVIGEFDAHLQGAMVTQTSSWTDLRLFERGLIGEQEVGPRSTSTPGSRTRSGRPSSSSRT